MARGRHGFASNDIVGEFATAAESRKAARALVDQGEYWAARVEKLSRNREFWDEVATYRQNPSNPATSGPAAKLTIPVLTKRIEASARMSGANHRGKQIDPRVAEAEWDRFFVIHGLRNYGAPVQRSMRDSFMTAFWRGAARGLANPKMRKRKAGKNPEDSAAALYEQFHGKPSERIDVIEESVHYHENLAALGQLVELKIKTPTRIKATLAFAEEGPDVATLASSEDGRQLFVLGGNQELDLRAIEMDGPEWVRDLMDVGELIEVTYHTAKGFHKFEPINYFPKLGEETGVKPRLLYDTRNKRLLIAGGQYEVKPEGIVN